MLTCPHLFLLVAIASIQDDLEPFTNDWSSYTVLGNQWLSNANCLVSGSCQSASPLPCWVPNMTVTAVHIIWLFAIVRLWSFGDFVIGEAMWWKCLLAQQVLNWFESKLGLHQGKWLSLNTMIRHYSHRALWKKDGRHWEWTRLKKAVWRTWKKTQGKV